MVSIISLAHVVFRAQNRTHIYGPYPEPTENSVRNQEVKRRIEYRSIRRLSRRNKESLGGLERQPYGWDTVYQH